MRSLAGRGDPTRLYAAAGRESGRLLPRLASAIELAGVGFAERFGMYDDEMRLIKREHLLSIYPVTARILGSVCFAFAIDAYLDERLADADSPVECGRALPHFLATFRECRELRYLADLARFECLVHEVTRAPESCPLEVGLLAADVAVAHRLTLLLSPAYALLASFWPVDRIWLAHGQDEVDEVEISCRQRHFEIWRLDGRPACRRLAIGAYRFRRALQMGTRLSLAAAAALDADRDFDLAAGLAELFQQGIVTGFTVHRQKDHSP